VFQDLLDDFPCLAIQHRNRLLGRVQIATDKLHLGLLDPSAVSMDAHSLSGSLRGRRRYDISLKAIAESLPFGFCGPKEIPRQLDLLKFLCDSVTSVRQAKGIFLHKARPIYNQSVPYRSAAKVLLSITFRSLGTFGRYLALDVALVPVIAASTARNTSFDGSQFLPVTSDGCTGAHHRWTQISARSSH
jgi:hypothetical protein